MQSIKAECRLIRDNAVLPQKNRPSDAGYDLYSVEDCELRPGQFVFMPIGLQLSVPEGWFYTIEGRSGMLLRGIITLNTIIDSGYIGDLFVGLCNLNSVIYRIKMGDRIAQLLPQKSFQMDISVVEEFSPEYNTRGQFGWGDSGR